MQRFGSAINCNVHPHMLANVRDHAEAVALAECCPHRQVGPATLHALNETEINAYQL